MGHIDLPDVLLHIDETLDHARLKAIEDRLRQEPGVISVAFHDDKPHVMVVTYDPQETRSTRILETVTTQGVHAELVGL
ncbi:MAG TPA: ATP-binding protein [bacterium]|jgi:hypothetical protein